MRKEKLKTWEKFILYNKCTSVKNRSYCFMWKKVFFFDNQLLRNNWFSYKDSKLSNQKWFHELLLKNSQTLTYLVLEKLVLKRLFTWIGTSSFKALFVILKNIIVIYFVKISFIFHKNMHKTMLGFPVSIATASMKYLKLNYVPFYFHNWIL